MSGFTSPSSHIQRIHPLRPRRWIERRDVYVLSAIYAAAMAFFVVASRSSFSDYWAALSVEKAAYSESTDAVLYEPETEIEGLWFLWRPEFHFLWAAAAVLIGVGLGNLILFICIHSFPTLRASISFHTCSSVEAASHILVVPAAHEGKPEIRELSSEMGVTTLTFQGRKYVFDPAKRQFQKMPFPVSLTAQVYSGALSGTGSKIHALATWPKCSLLVPVPSFSELFKDHALAPFFVFQMFCCLLWFFDEYWYYSALTAAMLIMMERMVVHQRLRSLAEIRSMLPKPIYIQRYNHGVRKWEVISSSELVPGELVSIPRTAGADQYVPADAVLLGGRCVVDESLLTGESVPQMKESIIGLPADTLIRPRVDKIRFLYAGTKVLQTMPPTRQDLGGLTPPPNKGVVCYVVRTGFSSSQGKLVRMIVFAGERVSPHSKESGFFIAGLLALGFAVAYYVIEKGLEVGRPLPKLLLHAAQIVTTVVPPELPVELSLAVTTSLGRLSKSFVSCTEPFRIPFGGKVDTCCLDKTGTLTDDRVEILGVVERVVPDSKPLLTKDLRETDVHTQLVLAGCQALTFIDRRAVGDPLELLSIELAGWSIMSDTSVATSRSGARQQVSIEKRHYFSSELKRMSSVVSSKDGGYCVCKGAPEVLRKLLREPPAGYDEAADCLMRDGARVLALAYRKLGSFKLDRLRSMSREEVESELEFAGFLVASSPAHPDALSTVRTLQDSSHRVVMITGDNHLTAVKVSSELGIVSKPVLLLRHSAGGDVTWEPIDRVSNKNIAATLTPRELSYDYDLSVSGDDLAWLLNPERTEAVLRAYLVQPTQGLSASSVVPYVSVFARAYPEHKTSVVRLLERLGHAVLMCGDGTNDVGALKAASVGIALCDLKALKAAPQPTRVVKIFGLKVRVKDPRGATSVGGLPSVQRSLESQRHGGSVRDAQRKATAAALHDSVQQQEPIVKLGDAVIAAPFAARNGTVKSCEEVIRQGRATLVTTMQIFKILALNCLVSAYTLSVLFLDGIKFGDRQMTIVGTFLTPGLLLFVTRAKPAEKLAREPPASRVFSAYILLSILGQWASHMAAMLLCYELAGERPERISTSVDFSPSLHNSIIFLVELTLSTTTMAVNYTGAPFTESVRQNKPLLYNLVAIVVFLVVMMLQPPLAGPLVALCQVVKIPAEIRLRLAGYLLGDVMVSLGWERLCRWLLAPRARKNIH